MNDPIRFFQFFNKNLISFVLKIIVHFSSISFVFLMDYRKIACLMKSFVQLQNDRFYKSLFEKMFFHKKHRLEKNVNSVKKRFFNLL